MKKLLIFGLGATVLNVLVVWVLTHFLIMVLGAACPDSVLASGQVCSERTIPWLRPEGISTSRDTLPKAID